MIEIAECTAAVDNFALSLFLLCRRKFAYRILNGLVPKRASIALSYGAAIHEALAAHYTGQDPFAAFDSCWDPAAGDDRRNRPAAFQLLLGYIQHYQPDLKPLHVEVGFQFDLSDDIKYRGRIDLIAEDPNTGWLVVVDHKTTSKKPTIADCKDRQISGYVAAVREIISDRRCYGGFLNYLVTTKEPQFHRRFSMRNEAQLEEWRAETIAIVNDVRSCETFYRNTGACNYYSGCEYLDLCTAPAEVFDALVETHYDLEPWEPYSDEGEILE